jgi:uncharacterized surface protein with fasciclin (FAS1) repeats
MNLRSLVFLGVVGLVACGGGNSAEPAKAGTTADALAAKDIVDTATSAGAFGTLVNALNTADFADTLKSPGPFTVFAPTDDAFAKLPQDQLDALMRDKEKLRTVLAYHVLYGKIFARDLNGMTSATTLAGPTVSIDTSAGLKIGGANVVQPDVAASNGVIHVIDAVLLPPM